MARMAGWIGSILAVRLLGRASISLMAPARRTVGLDWIYRTTCLHRGHTGRPRACRPGPDPPTPGSARPGRGTVPRHRRAGQVTGRKRRIYRLSRGLPGESLPDRIVGCTSHPDRPARRNHLRDQNVTKSVWLCVLPSGYPQDMSEWSVPGEPYQTAWSVDCSGRNAHAIPPLPDQWGTSGRKAEWHDQFGWLARAGLSAPGLYRSRIAGPDGSHAVG